MTIHTYVCGIYRYTRLQHRRRDINAYREAVEEEIGGLTQIRAMVLLLEGFDVTRDRSIFLVTDLRYLHRDVQLSMCI